MVESAITVVGAAIVYSLTVFFFGKQTKPDPEPFNVRKFTRAVIIGIGVGAVSLQMGITLSITNVADVAQSFGIVAIADQIVKAIFRNLNIDAAGGWISRTAKSILDYGS